MNNRDRTSRITSNDERWKLKNIDKNVIANLITFLRVLLFPWLVYSELQVNHIQSLAIMLVICATDIFDGMIARKSGKSNERGKVYDITADFMVVFSIFLLWYIQKKVAIYILFLLLFCFASFILLSLLKKKMNKNKIGQYAGTVCFAGIITILFSRILYFEWVVEVQNIVYIIISIFLIMSIIENIFNMINFLFPARN